MLAEVAKEAAKDTMDISLVIKKEFTVASILDIIESKVRNSGFHFRSEIKNQEHTLVIQHDMGRKWSIYMARLFEAEFEQLKAKRPEFVISDNTLVFKAHLDGDGGS